MTNETTPPFDGETQSDALPDNTRRKNQPSPKQATTRRR